MSDEAERLEAARRSGFYPLALLLDRVRAGAAAALGGAAAATEERVRFRHDPSLAFPLHDVTRVAEVQLPAGPGGEARRVVEIVTTFLGLTGAVTPLPPYVAEEVAQEAAHENEDRPAVRRDFLDLFHHRALSFFLRARAKYDPPGAYLSDQTDDWSRRVLAALGIDRPAARDAGGEPAWRLLRLAPLLGERAVTAVGLQAALADALRDELAGGATVEVEQFVGTWVEIASADRTRLGVSACELGRSTVLGGRVFDRAGKLRVVIGPLDRAGHARFAAGEPVAAVRRLVNALVGEGLELEVMLRLAPESAAALTLSSTGGARLGRDTWLGRQRAEVRVVMEERS